MTLLCPKYLVASDYESMDETGDYAEQLRKQAQTQPEEKGGEACPA